MRGRGQRHDHGAGFGFTDGQFGFDFSGPSGQTALVGGSADLVNWETLATIQLGSTTAHFSDPQSGALSRRLFRVRLP